MIHDQIVMLTKTELPPQSIHDECNLSIINSQDFYKRTQRVSTYLRSNLLPNCYTNQKNI